MGKSARWIKKILGLKKKTSSKDKTPTKDKTLNTTENQQLQIPSKISLNEAPPQIVSIHPPPNPEKKEEIPRPPPRADIAICPPKLQDRQIQCADEPLDQEPVVNRDDIDFDAGEEDMFPKVISKEDLAAVKIQKAYRGHVDRRALRALRGVIRLQALARAHAVRRQAAEALRCIQALVRVQAIFRGQQVRLSEEGQAIQYLLQRYKQQNDSWQMTGQEPYQPVYRINSGSVKETDKALAFALQRQVERSKTKKQPLYIDSALESGSGWGWLQRWTAARPWALSSLSDSSEVSVSSNIPRESDYHHARLEFPHRAAEVEPVVGNGAGEEEDATSKLYQSTAGSAAETDRATEFTEERSLPDDLDIPNIEDSPDEEASHAAAAPNHHLDAAAAEFAEFEKAANGHSLPPEFMDQEFGDEVRGDEDDQEQQDQEEDEELENSQHSPVDRSPKPSYYTNNNNNNNNNNMDMTSVENSSAHRSPSVPSYMAATKSAKAKVRPQSPKSSSPTAKRRFSVTGKTSSNNNSEGGGPRRLSLPAAGNGGGDGSPRRLSVSNAQVVRSPQLRNSNGKSMSLKAADRLDNGVRRSAEMRRSFKF